MPRDGRKPSEPDILIAGVYNLGFIGINSGAFADELLEQAAVVVSPGAGYGPNGEGFVRISLTVADGRLEEAMARIRDRLA
jgi:LL-diaminopimelate aminotransferase